MPVDIRGYRVFIASPGGLASERKAFRDTIQEYNEAEALARGVSFIPVGWEDTLAGVGRPQEIIDEDVKRSDFFVLVLWDRWGTPPGTSDGMYSSGTEEEFHIALKCLADAAFPMRKLVVLFKGVDERQLSDPGAQLQRVLEFRRQIERDKTLLYQPFDAVEEFSRILRRHLAQWVREEENVRDKGPHTNIAVLRAAPTTSPVSEAVAKTESNLVEEAESLAQDGRVADAEALFAQAVVGSSSPDVLNRYGRFLRRLNRHEHARVIFEQAVSLAEEQENILERARALANLGVIARKQGQDKSAEEYLREAAELADGLRPGGLEVVAYAYGNLSQLKRAAGDIEAAEQLQRRSLDIQLQFNNKAELAHSYGNLGVVLRQKGDLRAAASAHNEGIRCAEAVGESGNAALAYNCGGLGLVLQQLGDAGEAIALHRRALAANEKVGHLDGQGMNHGHLADAYFELGDLENATKHNEVSFHLNARTGNLKGVANNCAMRARIAFATGDLRTAREQISRALDIHTKFNYRRELPGVLLLLGEVAKAEGQEDEAQQLFTQAEHAAASVGNVSMIEQIRLRSGGQEPGA